MLVRRTIAVNIVEIIKVLIFAFIISWGLRATVVDARVVPTPSMVPTIHINDRILVDKISYKFTKINRGDVIVFHPPSNVDQSGYEQELINREIINFLSL